MEKKEDHYGITPACAVLATSILIIHKQPGIKPAQIAAQLGMARSTITRRLPSLEEAGFLNIARIGAGGCGPSSDGNEGRIASFMMRH